MTTRSHLLRRRTPKRRTGPTSCRALIALAAVLAFCILTASPAAADLPVPSAATAPAGAEPLRDLIGAMHSKLLLAELRRRRDAR